MTDPTRNKRWLLIGWQDGQPIINLNEHPRGYHSLAKARISKAIFAPKRYDRETQTYVSPPELDTNRIVELTFTDDGITGRYVN